MSEAINPSSSAPNLYQWQLRVPKQIDKINMQGVNFQDNLKQVQQQQQYQEENSQIIEQKSKMQRQQHRQKIISPMKSNINVLPPQYRKSGYKAKSVAEYRRMKHYNSKKMVPKSQLKNKGYLQEPPSIIKQMKMYAQDQLLKNPGGDFYEYENGNMTYNPDYDHSDFNKRVGKDIKDAVDDVKGVFKSLLNGDDYHYIDAEGKIQKARKIGLTKHIENFIGNCFDALGIGKEKGAQEQQGSFLEKIGHAGKKIFVDAIVKDVVLGVPQSMLDAGQNFFSAILNALEVVPDATIGNTEMGRKITTKVFDNAQIGINYISDVMPTGEAWLRVNAAGSKDDGFKLPILYNLRTPQEGMKDMRWAHVRNTDFRKIIETIGTIFSDIKTHMIPFISAEPEININPDSAGGSSR
ncbi:hypothetical protein J7L67_05520 [bacterium]|nr:hypothetical protein [bacterium]